jgi:EAL domain-containing protein (putative c-di-GMP-specific phosphodiesterase class I)
LGQEDDLLALTRRLLRSPQARVAITAELSALLGLHGDPKRFRLHQSLLRDMASRAGGDSFVMRTGDVAIVVPPDGSAGGQAILDDIVDLIAKDCDLASETLRRRIASYAIPEQFPQFREWVARYLGRGMADMGGTQGVGASLPEADESLRGRMTADMLSRIEHRILRCDIREFVRQQPVCRAPAHSREKWHPVIQERFLGIEALRTRFFPGVELVKHGPLFQELCLILDERLVHHLLANRLDRVVKTSLNISIETALDPMIDLLGKRIEDGDRSQLLFEIACIEFLGDVARGQRAVARLRDYGFGVILDGVGLPLLPYLSLGRIDCDLIKVQFARDHVQSLAQESGLKAIRDLPPGKIVFSRCDHESAVDVGRTLGIGLYQGWLIDRLLAY